MTENWGIILGVVPANHFVVPARSHDQLGFSLTPLHRVNAFGVASGENGDWTLLVPEIPDLKLIPFLVIESDGQLGGYFLAPADDNVPVAGVG